MSSLLEKVISKSPKWMLDLLPDDLVKAIKREIHEPTTQGRRTAIDADNINDVAFYMRDPKMRKNKFEEHIKGTKECPYEYAVRNRKWKSITYLCGARQPLHYLNVFTEKGTYVNEAPKWYKYFYVMVHNTQYTKTHIHPKYYFPLIYDSPCPIDIIRMLLADYGETNKKYFTTDRLNACTEKDIEVFNNISNKKDKIELVRLVGKKKITMDISEVVEQDGNLTYIAIICGYNKLCDYVIQNGKIEEFKKFVSLNLKLFDFLGKCCIIMPQYKELYEIAYEKSKKVPKNFDMKKRFILDHQAEKLAIDGNYDELKFMLSKGYEMSTECERNCFRTLNRNMISLVEGKVKPVGFLIHNEFSKGLELVKMGYYPSVYYISRFYLNENLDNKCKNFDVIKLINPNDSLDELKYNIANYHPELMREFINKFSGRFADNSPDSWKLEDFTYFSSYCNACDILGIGKDVYVQKLFKKVMYGWTHGVGKEKRKMYRNIALQLFKWPQDVSDPEYIEQAIFDDDLKMAAELMRAGASPDGVRKWKKNASNEMYKVITDNL